MKVFENDADWEERAWELAKKLVSIDSSDPGAYEGEIRSEEHTSELQSP